MKKLFLGCVIKVGFLLFIFYFSACNETNRNKELNEELILDNLTKASINISVSEDLLKISEIWAKNYKLKNTNVNINLINSNTFDNNESDLLFITTTLPNNNEQYFKIKIAKDIIVPIFNDDNPHIQKLVYEGVKPEELLKLLFTDNIIYWSQLVESQKGEEPIIIYRHDDYSGATVAIKKYLKVIDKKMKGKVLNNDFEIIANVRNNTFGFGFCSYNNAFTSTGKFRMQEIYILPIDRNSNGIVDDDEHIFDRKDILLKAFINGNYPEELVRNTYVVLNSESKTTIHINFINWLLSEGQNYLEQFGLIPLLPNELKEEKQKIKL